MQQKGITKEAIEELVKKNEDEDVYVMMDEQDPDPVPLAETGVHLLKSLY